MSGKYHDSMKMSDGTRKALTSDEAKAIWQQIEASTKERAEKMPDAESALRSMISAEERLKELGWRDARYCPRDESEFAVCEIGSTGMWKAFYSGEFITYADCVSKGNRMYFKPLDKLTDGERTRIENCDKEVAAMIGQMLGDGS